MKTLLDSAAVKAYLGTVPLQGLGLLERKVLWPEGGFLV